MANFLEDDAIRLRAPEPEDLDALFAIENDESLWTVSCNNAPYSRRQLAEYIGNSVHDLFAEHQIRFIIELDGQVAGCVDLTDVDAVQSHAQVGIAVLSGFRGKGIAGRALTLLCGYAAHRLRLHQLVALIPSGNSASLELFSHAGFQLAGELKEWLWACGRYEDVCLLQKIL